MNTIDQFAKNYTLNTSASECLRCNVISRYVNRFRATFFDHKIRPTYIVCQAFGHKKANFHKCRGRKSMEFGRPHLINAAGRHINTNLISHPDSFHAIIRAF